MDLIFCSKERVIEMFGDVLLFVNKDEEKEDKLKETLEKVVSKLKISDEDLNKLRKEIDECDDLFVFIEKKFWLYYGRILSTVLFMEVERELDKDSEVLKAIGDWKSKIYIKEEGKRQKQEKYISAKDFMRFLLMVKDKMDKDLSWITSNRYDKEGKDLYPFFPKYYDLIESINFLHDLNKNDKIFIMNI